MKTIKTKFIYSLAVLITAIAFQARIASACDCARIPSVKESLERSTAVFSGKVISVDRKTFEVKFEVYRNWKGVKTKTVSVFSNMESCNYQFWKGHDYIVYAYGKKQLTASLCTRTAKLKNAQKDLAELGKGTGIDEIEFEQPNKYDITEIKIQQFYGLSIVISDTPVVLRLEEYEGYVNPDFYRLARWLEDRKFFELKDLYRSENRGSDGGSTEISVVRKGQRKTVVIEMESQELWEIEMVIRGVATQIAKLKQENQRMQTAKESNVGKEN